MSAYERNIDRRSPGCLVFLVDQSFSMTEPFAGSPRSKAEALATAINRFVGELVIRCERGEELPRAYFDVGVIGYTTDADNRPVVRSLLDGPLAGRDLVSIVDLYQHPLEVETRHKDDGQGGLVAFKFPVWYRTPPPERMKGTPMAAALRHCAGVAGAWCAAHPQSFPPVVIHLTDGEATDGSPEAAAEELRALRTDDGALLFFNAHLSTSGAEPVLFPTAEQQLPDEFARLLFRMSSALPEGMQRTAQEKGLPAPPGCRVMAFNADGTSLLLLLNVGSIISEKSNLR